MRPTHSKPIDAEKAQRILSVLREGKTLAVICSGRVNGKRVSSEIIITYVRFREYCDAHPDYNREAQTLLEANYKAADARKGERLRSMTHCKHGHSLDDAWVTFQNGYSKRDCRTCWLIRSQRGGLIKPQEVRQVKAAVLAGLNLTEITRGRPGQRAVVNFATLKRYRIEHPEVDRFIIENARAPLSRSRLLKCQIVPANAGFSFPALNFSKPVRKDIEPFLFRDGDLERVKSLIPRALPPHVRDEIVQNTFTELCARAVSRDEVPAVVKKLTAEQARMFPTLFRKFGHSPLVSLDELIFEDGSITRGDTVTHGLWD